MRSCEIFYIRLIPLYLYNRIQYKDSAKFIKYSKLGLKLGEETQ